MIAATNVVLVTGGTGHLGRDLVRSLVAKGRTVRVLATRPGGEMDVQWVKGDLATGEGVEESLSGVESVIHAATFSPMTRRGVLRPSDLFWSPSSVDVGGTQRLLEASVRTGVRHFLYVSIVGLEDTKLPYSRVKLAGERLVKRSTVPWSVVRATPFYYILANMLAGLRRMPVWPLPSCRLNPIDTTDVADYLTGCLDDGRRGVREEIGGPEHLTLVDMARQLQRVQLLRRPILSVPLPPWMARTMGFVSAETRHGTKTWSTWLHGFRNMRANCRRRHKRTTLGRDAALSRF
jgi:uncharacterized protein YbjT (DUF2867 family)